MFTVYTKTVEGWNVQRYTTMGVARFAQRTMHRNSWLCFIVIG